MSYGTWSTEGLRSFMYDALTEEALESRHINGDKFLFKDTVPNDGRV